MSNRILVKIEALGDSVSIRTISSAHKSPHRFYLSRDELKRLDQEGRLTSSDGASFARLSLDRAAKVLSIRFAWLYELPASLTGRQEWIRLPYDRFRDFTEVSLQAGGDTQWSVLSMEEQKVPRLIFKSRENLHAALGNKMVRRKLVRFLRDNFHWKASSEIYFYDDFIPYSFFFREFYLGQPKLCGGLIFHGQVGLTPAHYATHT